MGILNRFFKRTNEAKVVTLGVSGAGKTTLIRYMETGEPVLEAPQMTLGIDIRERGIEIGKWKLHAIDVGGQDLYKNTLWALGVTQSDGVIYVIDGLVNPTDTEKFKESIFSYEYMLSIVPPKKSPKCPKSD
ncbi:MAG: ADP-ribosylation factor-like protein [Candidatus Kariarchaeaceae archaeon]|jgi:Arf/Sar family protein